MSGKQADNTQSDIDVINALEPDVQDTGAKRPPSPSRAGAATKECDEETNCILDKIFEQYPAKESSLIMVLQEIQDNINWLPPEALDRVAIELNIPRARVQSVATFYKAFSLEPRGKKLIKICMGTACHVRGAGMLVEELERTLKIKAGHGITEDGSFSIEAVNCIGACAMAPAILVGDNYYANVTPGKLAGMLKKEQPK